jgi:hypothetical protein
VAIDNRWNSFKARLLVCVELGGDCLDSHWRRAHEGHDWALPPTGPEQVMALRKLGQTDLHIVENDQSVIQRALLSQRCLPAQMKCWTRPRACVEALGWDGGQAEIGRSKNSRARGKAFGYNRRGTRNRWPRRFSNCIITSQRSVSYHTHTLTPRAPRLKSSAIMTAVSEGDGGMARSDGESDWMPRQWRQQTATGITKRK